jgi:hypothetical protein
MTTITFTQDELILLGSSVLKNLFAWQDDAASGDDHAIKVADELSGLWEKVKAAIAETP